ncbi:MAG: ImmA/IrrE family metallo-endopeptidase [bacterium]|nr:ImmA/IrrE family metallo-endopeptidase [bacterium]
MTQDEVVVALAEREVSLTKAGLSKYERGGSTPKPTVLRELAKVLGVEAAFFLEEPRTEVRWLAFRKAARMGKKRQERVKAFAEAQLEVILALRRALEPGREEDLLPRTRVRNPQDAEKAANALREHWRLGDQPIDSVTAAIEDGGGVVVEAGGEDDLFDGLSGWADEAIPVVVVSSAVSDDRRRFSLSHELGHLFMEVDPKVDESTWEKLAHRFAAAFLVPAATARRELGPRRRHLDLRELAMLKQKHGLSMQAWIIRADNLGIIQPSHTRTLFATMSARGWRREEPVGFEGEERPTKLRQLAVRALAEGLLSRTQAERICPGITREVDEFDEIPPGAMDARSLLRLPASERDRLMEQAVAVVADEYEDDSDLAGFESLSWEDYFDTSLSD